MIPISQAYRPVMGKLSGFIFNLCIILRQSAQNLFPSKLLCFPARLSRIITGSKYYSLFPKIHLAKGFTITLATWSGSKFAIALGYVGNQPTQDSFYNVFAKNWLLTLFFPLIAIRMRSTILSYK